MNNEGRIGRFCREITCIVMFEGYRICGLKDRHVIGVGFLDVPRFEIPTGKHFLESIKRIRMMKIILWICNKLIICFGEIFRIFLCFGGIGLKVGNRF